MGLWYYQDSLVKRTANATKQYTEICVQSSTGSGKTMTFSHIAHSYTSSPKHATKSVLITVHRIELLKQTIRTLYKAYGIHAQMIGPGMKVIPYARVYVAMTDSLPKHLGRLTNIGLIIGDEAHRKEIYKRVADYKTRWPGVIILGFTATPITSNKKDPLKNHFQSIICGPQIKELIAFNKENPDKGLCQNVTICPEDTVDRGKLGGLHGDDFNAGLVALEFSKPRYVDNVVKAYEKYAKGTKAIVFNADVSHSLLVTQAFIAAGYECKHIDSDNCSTYERTNVMNWFANTRGAVLCNVGIATTGLDVPTIETVIVNLSTVSLSKWLQMTGRGSRPCVEIGKQMFFILDMGGNGPLLGDWSVDRDWTDIFFNPPAPSDKLQPAPVKTCPQCSALVAAQARHCHYCDYEFPVKPREAETDIDRFVVFTKDIDVKEVITKHNNKKRSYALFQIAKDLAKGAKTTIPKMDNTTAEFIYTQFLEKGDEWAVAFNLKGVGGYLRSEVRKILFEELAKHFKGWQYESDIVTVI